jgi:non-heme chloroperoxidase
MLKTRFRVLILVACGLLVTVIAVLGGMLAFGTKAPPPTLLTISKPFEQVDFSDLPPIETITSRTGRTIAFRQWRPSHPAPQAPIVIAIHGSSGSSNGLHALAKALSAQGMLIYAPDMRGHGESGRRGDIDYAGQLDDDLADLVAAVKAQHSGARLVLLGFSSGGGFALHVAASPLGRSFARTVLISPMLGVGAPTIRTDLATWAAVFVPRIVAITLLNRIGIHAFDHLDVIAFATDPKQAQYLAPYYSFLLLKDFGTADYAADLRKAASPVAILVGEKDELFYADKFAPAVAAVRSDVPVTVIPDLDHIEMVTDPRAIPPIAAAIRAAP